MQTLGRRERCTSPGTGPAIGSFVGLLFALVSGVTLLPSSAEGQFTLLDRGTTTPGGGSTPTLHQTIP